MKRYPAYDPPEFVSWRAEPKVMEEFRARLSADAVRTALVASMTPARHLALYAGLVRFRLHDIALKRWVKQGVISKAWLGTGEEAVTVGAVQALRQGDQVGPMIRNAGACHEMGMSVAEMLKAYLGTHDTIMRGRDLHTGDPGKGVIPPISMVAALTPIFTGIALGFLRQGRGGVALTWVGDGATRTTEFHEGASLAARLRAPAIFVIQNNQVALGTALAVGVAGDLRDLHRAYGARGVMCDGNNVLDVYAATRIAAELCRRGEGPVFLEAETFRMGGHATHDEAEARATFPATLFASWGQRDPIGTYETWLIESGPALAGVGPARALEAWDDVEARRLAEGAGGSAALRAGAGRDPVNAAARASVDAGKRSVTAARRSVAPGPPPRWSPQALPAGCGREAAGFDAVESMSVEGSRERASVRGKRGDAQRYSASADRSRGPAEPEERSAGSESSPPGHEDPREAERREAERRAAFDPARRNPEDVAAENRRVLEALEAAILAEVEAAAEEALRSRSSAQPPPASAIEGVY